MADRKDGKSQKPAQAGTLTKPTLVRSQGLSPVQGGKPKAGEPSLIVSLEHAQTFGRANETYLSTRISDGGRKTSVERPTNGNKLAASRFGAAPPSNLRDGVRI